jgi:hypothetical protein
VRPLPGGKTSAEAACTGLLRKELICLKPWHVFDLFEEVLIQVIAKVKYLLLLNKLIWKQHEYSLYSTQLYFRHSLE